MISKEDYKNFMKYLIIFIYFLMRIKIRNNIIKKINDIIFLYRIVGLNEIIYSLDKIFCNIINYSNENINDFKKEKIKFMFNFIYSIDVFIVRRLIIRFFILLEKEKDLKINIIYDCFGIEYYNIEIVK